MNPRVPKIDSKGVSLGDCTGALEGQSYPNCQVLGQFCKTGADTEEKKKRMLSET